MTTLDDHIEPSEGDQPSLDETVAEVLGLVDDVVNARLANGELARRREWIKSQARQAGPPPVPPSPTGPICPPGTPGTGSPTAFDGLTRLSESTVWPENALVLGAVQASVRDAQRDAQRIRDDAYGEAARIRDDAYQAAARYQDAAHSAAERYQDAALARAAEATAEARREADRIVTEARREAERIITAAYTEREKVADISPSLVDRHLPAPLPDHVSASVGPELDSGGRWVTLVWDTANVSGVNAGVVPVSTSTSMDRDWADPNIEPDTGWWTDLPVVIHAVNRYGRRDDRGARPLGIGMLHNSAVVMAMGRAGTVANTPIVVTRLATDTFPPRNDQVRVLRAMTSGEYFSVLTSHDASRRPYSDRPELLLRRAADTGNVTAMTQLGALLYERRDLIQAEHWWRRAADAGDVAAMNQLGGLLSHLRPDCSDRHFDDVEASVIDLLNHADKPIHNIEGWVRSRITRATVDMHRRRRGERGAVQRPRMPKWLAAHLDEHVAGEGGDMRWLTELALNIQTWVGATATAGTGLWPYAAWAERRVVVTGDPTGTESDVIREVEVVLAAMRRNPSWYQLYIERPLGRKQAPVLPAEPNADDPERGCSYLSLTQPHEAEDALLEELAAAAIDAIVARIDLGEDPRTVVEEIVRTLFDAGTGAEEMDRSPGAGSPETFADEEQLDRVVRTALAILDLPDRDHA